MSKLLSILKLSWISTSHKEKLVSALGAFLAILGILIVSDWAVGTNAAAIVVASMGASAVLLFAVPLGILSQPWPVFGGHIISAIIGVTVARYIPNEIVAASLAVGLAVGVMYYMHCIHPPGGATALAAVVGGEEVHQLGYQYVLTPILLNVLIILLIAIVFNALFAWRRYPAFWYKKKGIEEEHVNTTTSSIAHEDFVYALSQVDSIIDVSEQDLLHIYDLAMNKSKERIFPSESLEVGGFYSNGDYGADWSVRQIVEESNNKTGDDCVVIYKTVAGKGRRSSGYSSRNDFLRWAKYEVMLDEDNWKKVAGKN